MHTFINSLRQSDYGILEGVIPAVQEMAKDLSGVGIRCDIGHPHRFWEYGSALRVFEEYCSPTFGKQVLDVGAGWSPLGPVLTKKYRAKVTEVEPDSAAIGERHRLNIYLQKSEIPALNLVLGGVETLPQEQYDAVFCISVLEHVVTSVEVMAWANLASRVKPGGLLFLTVDCMDVDTKPHVFDNLRNTKYTPQRLANRIEGLKHSGLVPVGNPDLAYHGDMVHDYSFFRVAMTRPA